MARNCTKFRISDRRIVNPGPYRGLILSQEASAGIDIPRAANLTNGIKEQERPRPEQEYHG